MSHHSTSILIALTGSLTLGLADSALSQNSRLPQVEVINVRRVFVELDNRAGLVSW